MEMKLSERRIKANFNDYPLNGKTARNHLFHKKSHLTVNKC